MLVSLAEEGENQNAMPFIKKCITCGKEFNAAKHKNVQCCSRKCAQQYKFDHKNDNPKPQKEIFSAKNDWRKFG